MEERGEVVESIIFGVNWKCTSMNARAKKTDFKWKKCAFLELLALILMVYTRKRSNFLAESFQNVTKISVCIFINFHDVLNILPPSIHPRLVYY